MNLIDEALTYLSFGWAVYPCHSVNEFGDCSCGRLDCPTPGKHPVGNWRQYQTELPKKSEVITWFTSLDCNIGTLTGSVSGIVVVDVDGQVGRTTLQSLDLKPTLTARTGSGGLHLFYTCPSNEKIQSRVKALPGIDIRGEGGYIVLAPSYHISGNRYKWVRPRPLAMYDGTAFNRPSSYSYNGINDWLSSTLNGVSEGERNMTAARLAGRYFGKGLTLDETMILLTVWNQRNIPPLDIQELQRTVVAIQKKHESVADTNIETLSDLLTSLKRS